VPSLEAAYWTGRYCRRHRIPFIVDLQDLWPEAFRMVLKAPVIDAVLFSPFSWMAKQIYRSATTLIAVSQTYLEVAVSACSMRPAAFVVFLGTDLDVFDQHAQQNPVSRPVGEVWVTYVGTLGASYDINVVTDALALLESRGRNDIVFKVLGDGPQMEAYAAYARRRGIKCDFKGRMKYGEMVAHLEASDLAVNPIVAGATGSIINKHGDYAAAGLPVVNTQESPEYRSLLREFNCGLNCAPGDHMEVADAIAKLLDDPELAETMGRNSRRMAEAKFDRRQTYEQIVNAVCHSAVANIPQR
jgi:glycosyltransferase involved in cell wall biosynthesis